VLLAHRLLLLLEGLLTAFDLGGASSQFVQFDEAGLVDVDEPALFGGGSFGFALEPPELLGKDLIVGGGRAGREGVLTGDENFGA
jgi:hypothetical protein